MHTFGFKNVQSRIYDMLLTSYDINTARVESKLKNKSTLPNLAIWLALVSHLLCPQSSSIEIFTETCHTLVRQQQSLVSAIGHINDMYARVHNVMNTSRKLMAFYYKIAFLEYPLQIKHSYFYPVCLIIEIVYVILILQHDSRQRYHIFILIKQCT